MEKGMEGQRNKGREETMEERFTKGGQTKREEQRKTTRWSGQFNFSQEKCMQKKGFDVQ